MKKCRFSCFISVICRIGSLESYGKVGRNDAAVICRIGSLEMLDTMVKFTPRVICRIGSLEISIVKIVGCL